MHVATKLQGQLLNCVCQVGRITRFGDQLQVPNTLADGDSKLMRVDDARKSFTSLLTPRGLDQKVLIKCIARSRTAASGAS